MIALLTFVTRLLMEKVLAAGIKPGPILRDLKNGLDIVQDGRQVCHMMHLILTLSIVLCCRFYWTTTAGQKNSTPR